MRAGIFQCDAAGLSMGARFDRLEAAIAGRDLDLVMCPELFASGYHIGDAVTERAQAADGPHLDRATNLARATGTAVLYGYPERASQGVFNSAICVGPAGVLGHHRKLMIPPGVETGQFSPGQGISTFQLAGLRCSILICYDAEFPEAVRAVAQAGVDVVLVPTALAVQWGVVAEKVMPTRAFENGVWLLYANHAGSENGLSYFGGSRILAPNGSVAAQAGRAEELIVATLDHVSVAAAQKRLPYLADRAALLGRLG